MAGFRSALRRVHYAQIHRVSADLLQVFTHLTNITSQASLVSVELRRIRHSIASPIRATRYCEGSKSQFLNVHLGASFPVTRHLIDYRDTRALKLKRERFPLVLVGFINQQNPLFRTWYEALYPHA